MTGMRRSLSLRFLSSIWEVVSLIEEGLQDDKKIRVTAELNVFAAMKMMFILWN